ncbi:MAG: DUF5360 family protein [Hyphomonas sp.]
MGGDGLDGPGLISLPPEWLFRDYDDPRAVAPNWSFLPVELAFSLTAPWSLHRKQKGKADWKSGLENLGGTFPYTDIPCGHNGDFVLDTDRRF